jgi:hypothetical protein
VNKTVAGTVIAAFVVIDIALVAAARIHVFGTPPESDIPVSQVADAPTSAPGEQVAYSPDVPRMAAVSLANDGFAVSGVRGVCDAKAEPATVRVSERSGKHAAAKPSGLTTILAAQVGNGAAIALVGQNADCDVVQVESRDGGRTWAEVDDVSLWHVDPQDARRVVSPKGVGKPGCEVVSVSHVTGGTARVACADGTLMGTGDFGKSWTQLGTLTNVRQVAFTTPSAGTALARHNGCAAHAFTTADGGASWVEGGCIAGEPAQGLAASTNGFAALVDDDLYVSGDAQEWTQR